MDKKELTLRDLWEYFLGNIFLFVGSILIALSVALIYIVVTPPQYSKSASILIKDDARNQMYGGGGTQKLEDMGLFKSYTDINNELYLLKTPRLMYKVAQRLGLDYNYSVKFKNLRWVDLYNGAPFRVKLDSVMLDSYVSFNLSFEDSENWEITDLKINGVEYDSTYKGQFGKHAERELQHIVIEKSKRAYDSDNLYSFSKVSLGSAAVRYAGALSVGLLGEESSIVNISIVDGSAHKASDIVNTLIDVYKENWIEDRNKVTVSTSLFIDDRLRVIEQELGDVDNLISSYKSENLLPDIVAVTGINLQNTERNISTQLALSNQLSMAKYIQEYMSNVDNAEQLLPMNTGLNSGAVESLIAQYNEQLLLKSTLLMNSSDKNPVVADMAAKLDSLKRIIDLSISDLISTLELQLKNERRDEALYSDKLASNPSQEKYLLTAGRQQKVKEALYLFLLQKREENELTQAFTAYNTVTLNLAQGEGGSPVAPRRMVVLLFALAIGFAVPILYLLLRESFNTIIQGKEDLSSLNIPYLGSIPQIDDDKRSAWSRFISMFKRHRRSEEVAKIIIGDKSRNVSNEAFRIVRTNLDFMSTENTGCKVSIITSINPGSGKSFIAANLSLSMALKNTKVLAIDADMRRATLSKYVNSPSKGLSTYLSSGVEDINDVIVKGTLHPNLDVLAVGAIPPNPSELLLLERFDRLISTLRGRYDYIFIDGTPVDIVTDAKIVERVCDSTIFVVRAGLMDKRLIPDLATLYEGGSFKNMSLLLNGVDYNRNGYYGYGNYGYSTYGKYGKYGYAYSYYGSEHGK